MLTIKKAEMVIHFGFFLIGPGEMIRTSDPHNPIVVRYQAALRPERRGNTRQLTQHCQSKTGLSF